MKYEELYDNIVAEKYHTKLKYPSRKDGNEKEVAEARKRYNKSEAQHNKMFYEDAINTIIDEYNLNEEQARCVMSMAWDIGHSSGYMEVISFMCKYAEFANDILTKRN